LTGKQFALKSENKQIEKEYEKWLVVINLLILMLVKQ